MNSLLAFALVLVALIDTPTTALVEFAPGNEAAKHSDVRITGQCRISAVAVPQRLAYHCEGGRYVLDPCFTTSATVLVCPDMLDATRAIVDTERPVSTVAPAQWRKTVWAMQLASGGFCQQSTALPKSKFPFHCRGGNRSMCTRPDVSTEARAYFVRCANPIADGYADEVSTLVKTAYW